MKTKLNYRQIQEALEAIEVVKLKHGGGKLAYALAKNTISLNRHLKEFHQAQRDIRAKYAKPEEKVDPSSETAQKINAELQAFVGNSVEVSLHSVKLSELVAVWDGAPFTVLLNIDFFIVDDLPEGETLG